MSRLPAVFATGLILALAGGAAAVQRLPATPEPARLTGWPQPAEMPGFGDDGTLGPAEISDLTEYVLALAGAQRDEAAVIRAVPLYQTHCAACHGLGGEGAEILGTPDLTRRQFRVVTGPADIRLQIWHGDDGRGPMREAQRRSGRPHG
ncbi:c-type cytochrome [Phenylobacterium koreense]|uniref:Mono/diheme cytochrome c family protein n=1 Tax=Phenylobacterium koreense TaxID=266125 RepID=A0ABV2EIU6_9CAUL